MIRARNLSRAILSGILLLAVVVVVGVSAQQSVAVTSVSLNLTVGQSSTIPVDVVGDQGCCGAFDITLAYDPGIIRVIGIDMGDYLKDQYGHLFIGDMSVDPQSGRIHVAATALGSPQVHSTSHLFLLTVTGLEAGNARLQISDSVIGDLSGDLVLAQYTIGDVRVASPTATLPPQTCELTSNSTQAQVVITNRATILSRPLLEADVGDMVGTISNTTANVRAVMNDKSGATFLQIFCNDRTGWIRLTGDMNMIGTWN